jgi:predicted RNA-binding protein
MDTGDLQKEIMRDVGRIEAEGEGFWLTNLFGEKVFIKGSIQSIDLVDKNLIILSNGKIRQ